MPFAVLFFLAALPDPNSGESVGWIVLVVGGLALTGNNIMGAVLNWRKLRGGDPASDERYVSKGEHASLVGTVTRLEGQIAAQGVTIATELRAINRSLGRLEGAAGTDGGR